MHMYMCSYAQCILSIISIDRFCEVHYFMGIESFNRIKFLANNYYLFIDQIVIYFSMKNDVFYAERLSDRTKTQYYTFE